MPPFKLAVFEDSPQIQCEIKTQLTFNQPHENLIARNECDPKYILPARLSLEVLELTKV